MTTHATIATVVEGHGETAALPILLRRIAREMFSVPYLAVPPPFRVKRHRMTSSGDLSRAAQVQAARISDGGGGVLVLADADDDCAVTFAAGLQQVAKPTPLAACIAVREFESWFLAAAESLRNHRAVRSDAAYHGNPEARRGAKEALSELMTEPYRETLHQPSFVAIMDLQQACRARSFEHLVRSVGQLLGSVAAPPED